MILKKKKGFEWLEFELLQPYPFVRHLVSAKGTSRKQVSDHFKTSLLTPRQVHGSEVKQITQISPIQPECDGLSTKTKGLSFAVQHADCQAAIIYDPVHHAIAAVHSGWRGSVQNIYKKAISHMEKQYQSNPDELIMCIGPSLGPEHAEFIHYQSELPKEFWKYQVKPLYFDFWTISKQQVLECGILPQNLEIAKIDTFSDHYYSYRKTKTSMRHFTAVCLL